MNNDGKLIFGAWPNGSLTGNSTVPLNTWTHVAVTWGTGLRLYINGAQDAYTAADAYAQTPYYAYLSGWGGAGSNGPDVDEVRICSNVRTFTPFLYKITGTVRDGAGNGVGGVTVSTTGASTTSAGDGIYTLTGLVAGSYTVSAVKAEMTFTSVKTQPIAVNEGVGSATGVDFTGAAKTYSISGKVADSGGTGIDGVTVSTTGASTTTAGGGFYTLSGLIAGSYTVSASKAEMTFTVVHAWQMQPITVNETVGSATEVDFVGTVNTYSISGTVYTSFQDWQVCSGVTVSTTGASTTTAADGTYTLSGLLAGSYYVSAAKSGITFDSVLTQPITVDETNGDATGVDFTAPPAPTLAWTGAPGYEADGVEADSADPGSTFTFRVKYQHPLGTAPRFVNLNLVGPDGKAVAGSPMRMRVQSGDWTTGAIFSRQVTLSAPGRYSYAFVTSDGTSTVRLPATGRQPGPVVNTPPALAWAGTARLTADGVDPDWRAVTGDCAFAVKYTDTDGNAPAYVKVRIWRAGGVTPDRELSGSPFVMTRWSSPADWTAGVLFKVNVPLPYKGTYHYQFVAADRFQEVSFPRPPAAGPRIGGVAPASLTVNAACAQPVAGGATLTYSLSAPAEVQAVILNMAGRVIAEIPAGAQEAGVQTLRWNGRNLTGSLSPAGVYLVRLTARSQDGAAAQAVTVLNLRR